VNSGNAIIIAATILGLSLITGAYLMVRSIDGATKEVGRLGQAVARMDSGGGGGEPSRPPRADTARRRGPDPNRVYDIAIGTAPTKGPDDAPVTVIEYSDFQCPFCGRVKPTLDQVQQTYGEDVRIVFKHLPLRIHPQAPMAHAAAEAAKNQGKFWEMHDLIFSNQSALNVDQYVRYAESLNMDVEQFKSDMNSPDVQRRVNADAAQAAELGVTGTPGFFVNGRFFSGAKPFAEFKRVIDDELAEG